MIERTFQKRPRDLGGFTVGRVLPVGGRGVGPFIFFDHMGPAEFQRGLPKSTDVRPHPHIGLATVTYLMQGEIMHRDSVGSEQAIRPEEVNWMTAGRGITHSERFEKARAAGDRVHGLQAWVALPEADEECEPAFAHHGRESLPTWSDAGVTARLIAGEAYGLRSPVRTLSPLFYVHAELQAGARMALPDAYGERAIYVTEGRVEAEGHAFNAGDMPSFAKGADTTFTALERSSVMLLGGDPVGPRFIEWNFVSSRRERIEQAKADWRAGRMKLPDLDNGEFIPLP